MSGGNDITDATLWRRWRDGETEAGKTAIEPDALTLAAYAENRLGRPGTDPEIDPAIVAVEAWLAAHPETLDDVMSARTARDGDAAAAIVTRAQELIAAPQHNVVPLIPARTGWRAVAWSSIAASLIAASLVGFSLGTNVVNGDTSQDQTWEQALIGPSASIIATDDEDSGI